MVRTERLRRRDDGYVIVLVTLLLTTLLVIVALVVDIGSASAQRRNRQNLVDSSALAGGITLQEDAPGNAKVTARQYIEDNVNGTLTPIACGLLDLEVLNLNTDCYTYGGLQVGITSPYLGSDDKLRVETCEDHETNFAQVIGWDAIDVCAKAVAEVAPTTPATPGGPAIHALGASEKHAFETSGDGKITVGSGDIVINSDSPDALSADGKKGLHLLAGNLFLNENGDCLPDWPTCSGAPPPEGGIHYGDGYGPYKRPADDPIFVDEYGSSIVRTDPPEQADFLASEQFSLGSDYTLNGESMDANDQCPSGYTDMSPGWYGKKITIKGCVNLLPGVYRAAGWVIDAANVKGEGVFLFNDSTSTFKLNAIIDITAPTPTTVAAMPAGNMRNLAEKYQGFLLYHLLGNTTNVIIGNGGDIHFGGIIYAPSGQFEINGGVASTFGDATLGASIVANIVKVKSDGELTITQFAGFPASGSSGFVRLAS